MPPGRLMAGVRPSRDFLFDIGGEFQMQVAPMAAGTATLWQWPRISRTRYAATLEWSRIDQDIVYYLSLSGQKVIRVKGELRHQSHN